MPVVLFGFESWSVRFSEERTMRVYENKVLRRIFGVKGDEVKRSGENYIMRTLILRTPHTVMFGR